jgi:hypothetical protein
MRCSLRDVPVVALLAAFLSMLSLPAWAQAGTSRTIPTFPRPTGSPDPALRVEYTRDTPMMLRTGPGSFEPLYRRSANGGYTQAHAAGYSIAIGSCPSMPSATGDPRTRMIDLAAAEWAYFGLPVLDLSVEPAAIVPRLAQPGEVVDIIAPRSNASIGDRVLRQAPRLGLMEDDDAVRATIAGYWAATGNEEALQVQSIVGYGWHDAGWAMPWSAAFISWLACEAGWSPAQFRRSGSHFDYVRAAVRARDGSDPFHAYVAYDLAESVPAAGDLLCTARGPSTFSSIADVRNLSSDSLSLHCDLVVKTDPARRRLYGIGGNVNHAVTLSIIATDAAGRPLTDRDIVGASRWFALLKPRQGGTAAHDLDGTPAVRALYRNYARYAGGTRAPPPLPLPPATPPPPTETSAVTPEKSKSKSKDKSKSKSKK